MVINNNKKILSLITENLKINIKKRKEKEIKYLMVIV